MKFLTALCLVLIANSTLACPDLSGEYKFRDTPWNGSLKIKQKACEEIEIRHIRPKYKSDFTMIYKIDDKAYQGAWYQHIDPEFNINIQTEGPIKSDTHSFHKVRFDGNKLSILMFEGAQKNCSSYTFLLSDCTQFEYSYEIVENGLMEYGQIGFGKSKSDYSADYFYLIK